MVLVRVEVVLVDEFVELVVLVVTLTDVFDTVKVLLEVDAVLVEELLVEV